MTRQELTAKLSAAIATHFQPTNRVQEIQAKLPANIEDLEARFNKILAQSPDTDPDKICRMLVPQLGR